jgi:serine/threonine protein kinase
MPFIDCCYLAPKCYNNRYSLVSDVFSFGRILDELLTGQPVFSNELTAEKIRFMGAIERTLPDIQKFVLPSARDFITDY